MYKLFTTAGFFATRSAAAVTNPLSGAELGERAICTLDPFALDASGVLICSESAVPLFGGVGSGGGGVFIVFTDVIKISLLHALKNSFCSCWSAKY